MSKKKLPASFSAVQGFADKWSLDTELERNRAHLGSTMREIREFYDAMLVHSEAIVAHFRAFDAQGRHPALTEEDQHLFHLLLSLAEVSQSIEVHGQIGVVDGFDSRRWIPEHELAEWRDPKEGDHAAR
jgi:hypothetical protein